MTVFTRGVATFALLLPLSTASGQDTVLDSASIRAATRTLSSDLRNIVTAQEAYFVDHQGYARSIDERVPGLVCAIYVGNAPPPMGRGGEAEVVCRGP